MDCNYKGCNDKVFEDSDCCILHTEIPIDHDSKKFRKIVKLKDTAFIKKIKNNDYNFEGVKLAKLNLAGKKIKKDLNFLNVEIIGDVNFSGSEINGNVHFNGSTIGGSVFFDANDSIGKTIINGDLTFRGVNIGDRVFFREIEVSKNIKFDYAKIGNVTRFSNAKIDGEAWFMNSNFGNYVDFSEATIGKRISFNNSKINRFLDLSLAKINSTIDLLNTEINGEVFFVDTQISGSLNFKGGKIKEDANFRGIKIGGTADFDSANLEKNFILERAIIDGSLSFEDTKFGNLKCEESAFRRAKASYISLGEKEKADTYFYRERVAQRKQKEWYSAYLEQFIIQYGFGYGVHPWRVMRTWLLIILVFTVIYLSQTWNYSDFSSYLYSSIVTAITPGFGTYHPEGIYQYVASIEAIIGTFMWATFITTFARKYMGN